MTKAQFLRLRFLVEQMRQQLREWEPGERQFLAVLEEFQRHLDRVALAPKKWGVR